MVGYGSGYASSDVYYGQHTSTVPKTYQSSCYYNQYGLKAYELHTVRLKVPICCQACEEKINNRLLNMEGVQFVTCNQIKQKVVVIGLRLQIFDTLAAAIHIPPRRTPVLHYLLLKESSDTN
ncbi:hypothetical protein R1flu_020003 [Riccia fluitans]|uniref:HMA domain-containing protein n=1 Tax=Riccia fluitans TaxID=41844 RepID=A0ABD1ZLP5_9MARC